jgi:cytosine/adenosine deaminase-related metal-dependent hydrolase
MTEIAGLLFPRFPLEDSSIAVLAGGLGRINPMDKDKTPPGASTEQAEQRKERENEALGDLSRRDFMGGAAMGVAAAAAGGSFIMSDDAYARGRGWDDWRDDRWNDHDDHRNCPRHGGKKDRLLLKGGIVMTLDSAVGNFTKADVLIEGKTILAVQPNIRASNAETVDCTGMIVMPGFFNTHHHQFYTPQRSIIADGNILQTDDWPQEAYNTVASQIWTNGRLTDNGAVIWDLGRSPYDPEDCYLAELIASVNQIDQGVTMGIDTSQSSHNPQYTDAMIEGVIDSGRRTLYSYSQGRADLPGNEWPGAIGDTTKGLGRIKKKYFSSSDQLVTLSLNTSFNAANYALARSMDVPLLQHQFAGAAAVGTGLLGPDNEYIHCTRGMTPDLWQLIADTGGHVSIATTIEEQMGHGIPPIQDALDHGILPSLSSDVETNMTPNMFTIMRSTFTLQRMNIHTRNRNGETNVPPLLTCYQTLMMATIAGARCAHVENKVGTLTPGKEADIIILEARKAINSMGFFNVPGVVVTLMDTSNVKHVMIAGKFKKWNGKLVGVDLDRLARKIEASQERILARIKSKPIPVDGQTTPPGYSPTPYGSCCVSSDYPTRT